jgi:hypothetical protein
VHRLFQLIPSTAEQYKLSLTESFYLIGVLIIRGTKILRQLLEWGTEVKIFILISIIFLCFYVIQIPQWTTNSDVLVYSAKAAQKVPDLKNAFFNENYLVLTSEKPLPNYHLGHTLVLWLTYKLFPEEMKESIWPSGFISAICGALTVGLTYLIWRRLGYEKKKAIYISIIIGFIPSIWYHSLIGEVYSMQLLFILCFIYCFINERFIFSGAFFLFANLISPISGMALPIVFLSRLNNLKIVKGFLILIIVTVVYFLIYLYIDSNILEIFNFLRSEGESRGRLWQVYKSVEIISLNVGLFIIFALGGAIITHRDNRRLLCGITLSIFSQVLMLIILGDEGLTEGGSFWLLLFWFVGSMIGVKMAEIRRGSIYISLFLVWSVIVTYTFWIYPNTVVGENRYLAGKYISKVMPESVKIAGNWQASIGVVAGKYGINYGRMSEMYIELPNTNGIELHSEKEEKLLIVIDKSKEPLYPLKAALLQISGLSNIFGLRMINYESTDKAKLLEHSEKIYENDSVAVYRFGKS